MIVENILIIEKENSFRHFLYQTLQKNGFSVSEAENTFEGLEFIKQKNPEVIIVDIDYPELDKKNALQSITRQNPDASVIIITEPGYPEKKVEQHHRSIYNYLEKSCDEKNLMALIKSITDKKKLKSTIDTLTAIVNSNYPFDRIIEKSQAMKNVLTTIKSIIESHKLLLILGEKGTGKELIARTIHCNSTKNRNPFVCLDCSSAPIKLFNSILFGHEKGAFIGATTTKIGKWEEVGMGTMFINGIDSVDECTLTTIIKAAKSMMFKRLGGSIPIPISSRLICASHTVTKPDFGISKTTLLQSAFSVADPISIVIPPLRERKEDIFLLVKQYLEKHQAFKDKTIDPNIWPLFDIYQWPGNVKELHNVVERACILSDDRIQPLHLPEYIQKPSMAILKTEQKQDRMVESDDPNDIIPLEMVEKKALSHAIKVTRGNISLAAKKLGIGRATLYRKAKTYNLMLHVPG